VENGRMVRVDPTVVESNIHEPSDSTLLWDVVRVLTRILHQAKEKFGFHFKDHTRKAKKRLKGIQNAKNASVRKRYYKDLMDVTYLTMMRAYKTKSKLNALNGGDVMGGIWAQGLAEALKKFIELGHQVMDQTRRRVLESEQVPANEKIVSIFEPHTDIIIRDGRETEFGHKVCLAVGKSSLILDCVVEEGNPADSTLATQMVQRQQEIFGKPPRQVAFDGGFASKDNLSKIKDMGVKDVCFSKKRGMKITDMVKSSWVYKKLRNFRAGIEAIISYLKRYFGLTRCTWSGFESFKAYVWSSIVTANLLILARHLLS
jgi:IS5 family transposase